MMSTLAYVDPQAWMFTVPVVAAMLWLAVQPRSHVIKRLWVELREVESRVIFQLTGADPRESRRYVIAQMLAYWIVVAALVTASIVSVIAYLVKVG